ncbi:MAG: hypothetical protein AAFP79_04890 [Pseudomonadota bacterium]
MMPRNHETLYAITETDQLRRRDQATALRAVTNWMEGQEPNTAELATILSTITQAIEETNAKAKPVES